MKEIVFVGPFGGINKTNKIIGGGESGNLKTLSMLRSLKREVFLIEKPYKGKGPFASVGHLFLLSFYVFKVWFITLMRKPEYLHISGFYGRLVFFEYLLSLLSKLSQVKVVYEIRAGGADDMYSKGSSLYRYFFRCILRNSSCILCQGERYVSFSESLVLKDDVLVLFYPNFISEQLASYPTNNVAKADVLTLVYFGRIVEEKNIFFMIDVLCSLSHFLNCRLKLIGSVQDRFLDEVISYANNKGCKEKLDISPGLSSENLYAEIEKTHFFIFPTNEPREGHSNSLTEAMALGLIPIVSNHGFNAFVVGDNDLVIHDFNSEIYAERIKSIFLSGNIDVYSKKMRDRVLTKFTYQEAILVLEKAYGTS